MSQAEPLKGCDTRHLEELPSHSWEETQLADYATIIHSAIVEKETALAPAYWRLGMVLEIMRKKFRHGSWAGQLGVLGIEKTRSSKARAIYRAFSSEAEVAAMTVEQAYRARLQAKARPQKGRSSGKRKRERISPFLKTLARELVARRNEAVAASPKTAAALLPLLAEVRTQVAQLEEIFTRQAARPVEQSRRRPLTTLAALAGKISRPSLAGNSDRNSQQGTRSTVQHID